MAAANCSAGPHTICFACFEMDLVARELRKNGHRIQLQDQPFRILEYLALRAKQPILREELYSCLSDHGSYDSKHGLDNAIQRIRKALGDSVEDPRFIETLRGRGYRFLRDVSVAPCVSANSHYGAGLRPEPFLSALKEIREEFLATDIPQKLSELLYRLIDLIGQHREHPSRAEAYVLLESVQSARSQHNLVDHKISFDSAVLVFDDPFAISISRSSDHGIKAWHTLGRVRGSMRPFGRPVVLLVAHQLPEQQVPHTGNLVLSARKATTAERAVYEQTRKKTN